MSGSLARGVAQTLGGSASVAAVSLIRNVLIAQVMGPAAFGLWNVCLVAQKIAVESHLGALSAVAVESPLRRGAGDEASAASIERRAALATVLFGIMAGGAGAVVLRVIGGPPLDVAAVLLAVGITLQQVFFAETTILRSRRRFGGVSIGQGLFAAVYLGGLLWLLPDYYITGALAAGAGAMLLAIGATAKHTSAALPRPRAGDVQRIAGVLRRGAPIWVVQLTLSLMLQADRVVVGALLGQESLGYYSVLVLGGNALLFVPAAFSDVLWPFAGESFGRAKEDPAALREHCRGAIRHLGWLLVGILPLTLAAVEVLVAHYLPQYAPALPALRVYVVGLFPLAVVLPLRNVLLTVGAGPLLVRLQVMALVGLVALEAAACFSGAGLIGVAAAGAIAWSLLLLLVLGLLARRGALSRGDAVGAGLEAAMHLGLAIGLDLGLSAAADVSSLGGAALRLGAPALLAAVTVCALVARARRMR